MNLENLDTRKFANEDPRGLLAQFPKGAILDEAHRVPELFSYLQDVLDNRNRVGEFIITGSINLLIKENISQSLAGRISFLVLLPLSLDEIRLNPGITMDELIFKGFYPYLHTSDVEIVKWYDNYVSTYVERDVRLIKNISNLIAFEKFVKLCAGRVGQLLNVNSLAIESGVDNKTITPWLEILEQSYIVFRLQPHHRNFNKRIVKMPKLYFYDTGLLCSLLGINSPEAIRYNHFRGALFENLIIIDLLKRRFNRARKNNFYFWRNNTGNEIDLLIDRGDTLVPVEIKAGQTIVPDFFKGIEFWNKLSNQGNGFIIYDGNETQKRSSGTTVLPFTKLNKIEVI